MRFIASVPKIQVSRLSVAVIVAKKVLHSLLYRILLPCRNSCSKFKCIECVNIQIFLIWLFRQIVFDMGREN